MRRTAPVLARRAQTLAQGVDAGAFASSSGQSSPLRAFAAQPGVPTPKSAAGATPTPGSPTEAAQAAIKSYRADAGAAGNSGASNSPTGPGKTADSGSGGRGGGWVLPVLTLGVAGGGYYAYTQQTGQSPFQQSQQQALDSTQKAALDLFNKSKDSVQSLLPSFLGGGSKGTSSSGATTTSSSSSRGSDKLAQQKQLDQQEAGFKLLPPGSEDATATTAAADAATAASAAARDSLSAAADEFPGSSTAPGAAALKQPGAAAPQGGFDLELELGVPAGGVLDVQQIDMTPITDLFADVTGTTGASTTTSTHTPSSSSTSSSQQQHAAAGPASDASAYSLLSGVQAMQGTAAAAAGAPPPPTTGTSAAAAAAGHAPAGMAATTGAGGVSVSSSGSGVLRAVEDSELEKLCHKLGLSKDLAPAGLVAAANKAGLGPVSTTGGQLPPQMAQLNQATADARVLREVLDLAATQTAAILHELDDARRQTTWTEEAATKREASLTEHFKELMREQSRIHQELTAAAVKEAEQVLMADTAKAHLQERQERLALIDGLREQVNALALAFEQRTAQLRSAQDVNKVSVGMLSLSRALEEGAPIGPPLKQLASSCPGDPLIEAVAASLPPSAVSEGLPTLYELRQRFADVAQAAAEAAYFSGQEAQGGVLAHLAAKLAAKLKVDAGADVSNAVDSKLSQARALLQQGQLSAAAEALLAAADGTQATAAVQQWVADARARAAADQAVKLLQAHATATAGLSTW